MSILDDSILSFFKINLKQLNDTHFPDHDVIVYYGPIEIWAKDLFRNQLESLRQANSDKDNLLIILQTGGGSAETVEKMVDMSRHFYDHVCFLIPDVAMSAGTIWCMSGDKIMMDYSSSLGPIDPQVLNSENKWVPALGYLDKCDELINKSTGGTALSTAELVLLNSLDLASLRGYEQARDLTKSLLTTWLVKYKFKDWTHHRTDPTKLNQPVTNNEKIQRADTIADDLSDNSRWHSHGRMIGIKTLQDELRLEIDDFTNNTALRQDINKLHDVCNDYRHKTNMHVLVGTIFGLA